MPSDPRNSVQALAAGPSGPVRYVAYFRVITERQGRSGLGLDAQREAVARHVASTGGAVAAEFQEIESGKRKRPVTRHGACAVIICGRKPGRPRSSGAGETSRACRPSTACEEARRPGFGQFADRLGCWS